MRSQQKLKTTLPKVLLLWRHDGACPWRLLFVTYLPAQCVGTRAFLCMDVNLKPFNFDKDRVIGKLGLYFIPEFISTVQIIVETSNFTGCILAYTKNPNYPVAS